MTKPNQPQEEEMELGSLFVIIGKGFSNLFNFIGRVFKGFFHFLITILLFIKTNFKILAIASIIGGIIGGIIEFEKEKQYGADLQVKPNFGSARQLYNNVNFYNDLVKQKDTVMLAKTFSIPVKDAASLTKFEIFPIENKNDIIQKYDDLIQSVDTLTVKNFSFEDFKGTFTEYDYKVQNIRVKSTKSTIFPQLNEVIIESVTSNPYFNKIKELTNENLQRTDSILRQSLVQADTLAKVYRMVMLKEAEKQTTGTNIDLGGTKKGTKELELFETTRTINKDLKAINESKAEKSKVINVVSNFQAVGYEIKGIEKNYTFLIGALFVLLTIAFLLLKQLNNYLENYKKK